MTDGASAGSVGAGRRFKTRFKVVVADLLNLHEEPVFKCPVNDCEHTANYGREIWNHLFDTHHTLVVNDGE